jgi:hypothetical protein
MRRGSVRRSCEGAGTDRRPSLSTSGCREQADIKAKLLEQGIVTRTVTGRAFDAYMKADLDRLTPIIKSAGIGTPER